MVSKMPAVSSASRRSRSSSAPATRGLKSWCSLSLTILVVGRAVWLPANSSPDVTVLHEALPLEEIEPDLLANLPLDRHEQNVGT